MPTNKYFRYDCDFYFTADSISPQKFESFACVMLNRIKEEIGRTTKTHGKPFFNVQQRETPRKYRLKLMIPDYLLAAFHKTCVREFRRGTGRPTLYLNDRLFWFEPIHHEVFFYKGDTR